MPYTCDYCEYIYPEKRKICPFCGNPVSEVYQPVHVLLSEGYRNAPIGTADRSRVVSEENNSRTEEAIDRTEERETAGGADTNFAQTDYYQHLHEIFQNQGQSNNQAQQSADTNDDTNSPSSGYRVHIPRAEPISFPDEDPAPSSDDNFFSQFNSPPPRIDVSDFNLNDTTGTTDHLNNDQYSDQYTYQETPDQEPVDYDQPAHIHTYTPPRERPPRQTDWRLILRIIAIAAAVILVIVVLCNLGTILSGLLEFVLSILPYIFVGLIVVWLIRSIFR